MTDDEITRIKAQLAGLAEGARAQPLIRLCHLCMDRYWRAGAGTTSGLPYLEEATAAVTEAYGYLAQDDPLRLTAAFMLGWCRAVKHIGHNGPPADGAAGVRLLEEALGSPALPPVQTAMARLILAQLYVRRMLTGLQSPEFAMAAITGAVVTPMKADVDRAEDHLRQILATCAVPAIVGSARVTLDVTDAVRGLMNGFGAGDLGTQLDALQQAIEKVRRLDGFGAGPGLRPPDTPFWDTEWPSLSDPLDRPVTVVPGTDRDEPEQPRGRPVFAVDVSALRRELRELLPDPADPYAAVISLLRAEGTMPRVDEFVELAAAVVHSADPPTGADRLLLAASLYLRARRDDEGAEQDEDPAGGDARAAVESLLAAADAIAAADQDGVPALVLLAALLPGEALAGVARRFGAVGELLRSAGARALILPGPAGPLRWTAPTGRFETVEAADAPDASAAGLTFVLGGDPPPGEDDLVVAHIASLTQLRNLVGRQVRPVTLDPVFVANPRGDREAAAMEVMLLRRSFYPRSTGFGRLVENADGAGGPAEVAARLDASVLHLDCGITPDGELELADGAVLAPAGPAGGRGGLAILPPGYLEPAAGLLLAAGFSGVVGWRRPVPRDVAALMLFVLHAQLAERGRTAAEAVREVRRWLRGPEPAMLPSLLAGYAGRLDETAGRYGSALVYLGR